MATSHKQIWARAVGSGEVPEGREAEAMRLPSDATARQVMVPASCCCRHLHHMAAKQGCYLHTVFFGLQDCCPFLSSKKALKDLVSA